ncbi:MAG: hypothetical protein M5U07_03030 [Xanthobacteraceae bacterium]|nr:hypothetical protein [Xanthobacteraceae bacterium]PWB66311.1 MAG: hypothetical protein C3F17_01665 [Bradyrhizobiaceae bacterium]
MTIHVPKKRQRHHSYDESVNEPARVIEDEAVAVENEAPAEENAPEQRPEPDVESPAFEEE